MNATENPTGYIELLKIFVAAALGAFFTLSVTWLKAHRDAVKSQCDEFLSSIKDAADLGSEYWLTPGTDPDLQLMEMRLIGFQQRFLLLKAETFRSFRHLDKDILDRELLDFLDACTGGDFATAGRGVDIPRARQCQLSAAHVTARIWSAFSKGLSLSGYIWRWLRVD